MKKIIISSAVLAAIFLFSYCSKPHDGQSIINKAIETHGGDAYSHSVISFDFRGTQYTVKQNGNSFTYRRTISDSTGTFTDRLTNDGFRRTANDTLVALSKEDSTAYANGLNSVVYFALLPYKLNDAAVNKKLLGHTKIREEPYYEIEVTFDQQGGGTDYQDRYIYWIHQTEYTMDYLAYRFHTGDGGTRFREAYNVRNVEGILFADYHNYGGPDMERPLENYETYFQADTLNKVSEVNLDSVTVDILDRN
ncbi:DUF6503 family protein [Fodinibius salinus]|nr:DUF6503 family protein [Fodinibius salinus]